MTRKKQAKLVPVEHIYQSILILRGQRVLLDQDLAALYSVETRRLNEQVRRNGSRFPADFIFELTAEEFANLKSQIATSSWGGRRKRPLAFTEHGAIMAATVLNSARAVEMTIHVVRAFVQLRDLLASNRQLAQKLAHEVAERGITEVQAVGEQHHADACVGHERQVAAEAHHRAAMTDPPPTCVRVNPQRQPIRPSGVAEEIGVRALHRGERLRSKHLAAIDRAAIGCRSS